MNFWRSHAVVPLALMIGAFAALLAFSLDRPITDAFFYNSARGWLGSGTGEFWAHDVVHTGGRWLVRGIAGCALAAWLLSFRMARLAPWRRTALYVFVGIVASTALVGGLKAITNVDCPWDLAGYGGNNPYITLFGDRPDALARAKCFPGAHSSSGFALVCLYFALRDRSRRAAYTALALGIVVGVGFSIGQEARGAHFVSHDLASAAIVWSVLLGLYAWMLMPRAGRR